MYLLLFVIVNINVSQKSKQKAMSNGTSILDQAMNMNTNTTSDMILEPGQEAPLQPNNTNNAAPSFGDDIMSQFAFTETFTKRSTQFTTMSNTSSSNSYRKGIDVDDYFGNNNSQNNAISHQERIELNQKQALEKLKKSGDTQIGKELKKPINKQKKIKRRAISSYNSAPYNMNNIPNSRTGPNAPPKPMGTINNTLNDDMDDLNGNGDIDIIDSSNPSTNDPSTNTSINDSGLNSALGDSLASFDETQEADATALNLQKFEQARKAAMDQTAAFDEEEHLENCNVYVGGLHPEVDQAMLRKFFQHCGDIKQIRLDWRKKGFGFIHYSTHEQAREAIEDMDGRIIMGQPIKCRWAKNKNKEREREARLQEEREKELARANGVHVPDDPNEELNKDVEVVTDVIDSINSNHPQQLYHRRPGIGDNNTNNNNNNMNNRGNEGSATSLGFLSRGMGGMGGRKTNKSNVGAGPPPLAKMDKKDDGIEDNNDEVEYW